VSVKETVGCRAIFSLCNFGSPYSRGVVAADVFILKLASFVIFLVSSKLTKLVDIFGCGQ